MKARILDTYPIDVDETPLLESEKALRGQVVEVTVLPHGAVVGHGVGILYPEEIEILED